MNTRVSLVLMILFIVLGSFAFFDPLGTKEKEEAKQERESRVVWLKDTRLESITVPGTKLACALPEGCAYDSSGDWLMKKPIEDNADPSTVGTLASTLFNLSPNEKIDFDAPPDAHEFGLDQPQAKAELKIKGQAEPVLFQFGKASAVGPSVYLSVSTSPNRLFLVPNYIPGMLTKDPFHWRSKRLFPKANASAIDRLQWKSEKLTISAKREGEEWRLEKPIAAKAGKIMLEGLASTLAQASAKAVGTKTSGRPLLEIEFSAANGPKQKLLLYSANKKEFLATTGENGAIYVVEAAAFGRFQKSLADYRERSVLDAPTRQKIDEATFSFPREKQAVTMKRTGTEWAIATGDKPAGNLSQSRIHSFLDSLRDSDFQGRFPLSGKSREASAYKSQTADLELELKSEGATLLKTRFVVFDRQWALTEGEGEVRSLATSFLQFLPVRVSDFDEASNKTVVHSEPEKGAHDGHSH